MSRESFSKGAITFIQGSEGGLRSLLTIDPKKWHVRGLRHALQSNVDSSHPATIILEDHNENIIDRLDPNFLMAVRNSTRRMRNETLDEYSLRMQKAAKVVFRRDFPRTEIPPVS